jgi:hypothetical protein
MKTPPRKTTNSFDDVVVHRVQYGVVQLSVYNVSRNAPGTLRRHKALNGHLGQAKVHELSSAQIRRAAAAATAAGQPAPPCMVEDRGAHT